MDGVEVPVELERRAGSTAVEADDDGGGGGMARRGTRDGEAVRREDRGEAVEGAAGFAGAAGHGDDLEGRVEEAFEIDRPVEGRSESRGGVHGGRVYARIAFVAIRRRSSCGGGLPNYGMGHKSQRRGNRR